MNDQPGEAKDATESTDSGHELEAPAAPEPEAEPAAVTDDAHASGPASSGAPEKPAPEKPQGEPADGADGEDADDEAGGRQSAEEFAREHDPAKHDIAAGEESRQKGDWTADAGPRTSTLEEVRDGGYGIGSAAILENGAVPFGHPVKAWEDTKTFVTPDDPRYGDADPHLWFTDADAAQQVGFRLLD